MTSRRKPLQPAAPVTTAPSEPPVEDMGDPLRWMWLALVSGLYFVRWWQPTEGTMLGNTLAIAEGWFIALALAGWVGIRGASWRWRGDAAQWAVALLVGGQLVSGLVVVCTGGDRRAAVTLMWEWLALGVSFPLLRSALSIKEARREWIIAALAAVLTLSGYGLTQRYWFYPQMVAEYERLRQELDALEAAPAADGGNLARMQKLQADLMANGLSANMLSGAGRALFEGRLKHSTEALGRFALANTFAGLLLVWWLILFMVTLRRLAMARSETPPTTPPRVPSIVSGGVLLAGLAVIGYCLLLTKSRTAFVGAAAGLVIWTLASLLANQQSWSQKIRQVVLWSVVAVMGLGGITLVAGLTGGLDRLVLAEAPKSLQYRLEYWWSSLQVIREAPLLGVGPGQFRSHYLAHKLPRSSEEIADPHNLVLDVWANGGVISLIGLAWLVFLLFRWVLGDVELSRRLRKIAPSDPPSPEQVGTAIPLSVTVRESGTPASPARKIPQPKDPGRSGTVEPEIIGVNFRSWTSPIRWGMAAGVLGLWIAGGAIESLLLGLLVTWLMLQWVLDVILPDELRILWGWAAAGLGLIVHLCGAGGIAMPAITQLLLLVVVLAAAEPATPRLLRTWQKWGILVLGIALSAAGYWTAVEPDYSCRWWGDQGDVALSLGTRLRNYQQAMRADPWAPEPSERLAEFIFQYWRAAQEPDERDFQQAVEAQKLAIERNPASFHTHRTMGLFYAEHARRTGSSVDKSNAVREFQLAIKRYPHNAMLLAESALVFELAEDQQLARLTAKRALEQDDINHAAGHSDKWLGDSRRKELERLTK